MSTTPAFVTPKLLNWALDRSGLSHDRLAKKIGASSERLNKWLLGEAQPSFNQAQNFAKHTHTPFGFLFLNEIPEEQEILPDLRTVRNEGLQKPSPNLRSVVEKVKYQQEWYRDYLISSEEAEVLSFVGSVSINTPVAETVQSIRTTLNWHATVKGDSQKIYKRLIQRIEDIGVLVMQSGTVEGDTHRTLEVREFRGFAIADDYAPVIFVNLADARAARLFTLVHELVHIWIGTSGISNTLLVNKENSAHNEEPYCNRVAGELLVPEHELKSKWNVHENLYTNLVVLAKWFHVSKLVIARRAMDLSIISHSKFQEFYDKELSIHKDVRKKQSGGGNYYDNTTKRNGARLSRTIVAEALSGRLMLRDAGRLLNIAPSKMREFEKHLNQ